MADPTEIKRWMTTRAEEDDRLYARYGKPLEPEHAGEFVAISQDGRLITGTDELHVAQQALKQFGEGTFALRRLGADEEIRWRTASP